ncbi:hypothetical protein Pan258_01760 [Symmachiella dynata]|uniref:hypothetical protein n=1 Tax=Symmachiella dynata TaxID=2527995 RepID=UPI00118D0678|nr:hypothetical protein [Symmachiella dynata]QDT46159.1 hypothetical protein Pan258_01760 [Symmachiella dynata]
MKLFRMPRNGDTMVPVFYGYIEAERDIDDNKEVVCMGMLEFFRKRITGSDENFNGQGSTEAFGLVSDANTLSPTGITAGSGGVTSTKDVTLDQAPVLSAWEDLAAAHSAEFEISPDGVFDFVSSLGSDKSSTIELTFRTDGGVKSDLEEYEMGEDAKKMVTRVIGTSSAGGGISYTYNDTTAQSEFGDGTNNLILIEKRNFSQAQDIGTLTSITTAYGSQISNPLTELRVQPILMRKVYDPISNTRSLQGLEYDDLEVGDLITAIIETQNETIEETKRIAELVVRVDENGKESLVFTLSKSGVFITAAFLDGEELEDVKERLKVLENA